MRHVGLSYQDLNEQILCETCGVNKAAYTVEGADICKCCSKIIKHSKLSKGEEDEE